MEARFKALAAIFVGIGLWGCIAAMDEPAFHCYDDDECPANLKCLEDVCKPPSVVCKVASCHCSVEDDCPEGFVCKDKGEYSTQKQCYEKIRLEDCLDGGCECGPYSICPEGYTCEDGSCLNAEDRLDVCQDGSCDCDDKEDCPGDLLCDYLDGDKRCLNAELCDQKGGCSCSNDDDCPGSLFCVKWKRSTMGRKYCHSVDWCVSTGECECDSSPNLCPDGTSCVLVEGGQVCYTAEKCGQIDCGCDSSSTSEYECPAGMTCSYNDICKTVQ